jgi:hypothetical protein
MNENLASIFSSIKNNPVSNWARGFGGKIADEKYEGKGFLNYLLNPLRKPGRGQFGGPTVEGDSSYANTMIRGQSDKSIQAPDAVAGAENAAAEATNLAGQNIEGLGKPHGWHDFASTANPNLIQDMLPRGGGNMVGLDEYQDRFNIAEDERVPTTSPLEQENADLASSWQTPGGSEMLGAGKLDWTRPPGTEPAPFVDGPSGYEPGGEEFRSSEYTARAPQQGEVGGGQGFDLLGWLNKLPSGQKMRDADLARPNFGSQRPGTTYDGSIQGGGYFTPEEYGRHYSRYGRGA